MSDDPSTLAAQWGPGVALLLYILGRLKGVRGRAERVGSLERQQRAILKALEGIQSWQRKHDEECVARAIRQTKTSERLQQTADRLQGLGEQLGIFSSSGFKWGGGGE